MVLNKNLLMVLSTGLIIINEMEQTNEIRDKQIEIVKKYIKEKQLNMFDKNDVYKLARVIANTEIARVTQRMFTWNELPDTNSLWDVVHENPDIGELIDGVKGLCEERLNGVMDGLFNPFDE